MAGMKTRMKAIIVTALVGINLAKAGHGARTTGMTRPRHPFDRRAADLCGHGWQDLYAQLHHAMLSRESSHAPRYAVSLAVETGLADRIIGALSIFYYSLLSGRAFQMATYDDVLGLDAVFDPGRVDWRLRDALDPVLVRNLKRDVFLACEL